jgi:release factor glutamine methyltransferase
VTTIGEARRAMAAAFREAGLDTPDLDARVLVGHALGLDHVALVANAARLISEAEAVSIAASAARRLAREPVSRITGTREFYGLPFEVTSAVLVPRPETETIVELALELAGDRTRPLRIADLGTGSGAILLALLSELKQATGTGTDIDENALETARRNARTLGMSNRAEFLIGNFGASLSGSFDLVVSNPPYIATTAIPALDPEVRNHDPMLALDGGADGLNAYRAVAADARRLIGTGHLVVEIGAGQDRDVMEIFAAAGLAEVAVRADLNGIPRAVAVRPA